MLLLPATVTMREARDTLRMLAQALPRESGAVVSVDASALRQVDSSALAVLLECQRRAQAAGKSFVVNQVPAKLGELARLYGLDALLLPAS